MTRSWSQRVPRFVALLMLCSAVFSTFYLPVAEARPAYSWDCDYYSDASYTTIVGYYHFTCSGNQAWYGTVTDYRICEQSCCSCTYPPLEDDSRSDIRPEGSFIEPSLQTMDLCSFQSSRR